MSKRDGNIGFEIGQVLAAGVGSVQFSDFGFGIHVEAEQLV